VVVSTCTARSLITSRCVGQARDKVLRLSEQLEWSNAELEATRAEADRLGKDLDDIKGSERGFESVLRDTRLVPAATWSHRAYLAQD
jgi:hypothetical protein